MDFWIVEDATCGTIACIGGTAELVGNLPKSDFHHAAKDNSELYNLFCPDDVMIWDEITVEEAAMALRSYLTTGKADWSAATTRESAELQGGEQP